MTRPSADDMEISALDDALADARMRRAEGADWGRAIDGEDPPPLHDDRSLMVGRLERRLAAARVKVNAGGGVNPVLTLRRHKHQRPGVPIDLLLSWAVMGVLMWIILWVLWELLTG